MPTLVEEPLDRTTLYYREGSSDKVYQCAVEAAGTRFVVNFAYGRRGSTLNTGTKTNVPVDYDDAKRIYDKLVREKTGKGYTPGENGSPYENTSKADRFTGLLPQLLNPIDEAEVNRLLADPNWFMQQKMDGKRVLLRKEGAAVEGSNRKGLVIGLPSTIINDALEIPGSFILDGECIGEVLHVFDLLSLNRQDCCPWPYKERYAALINLLRETSQHHVELVPSYSSPSNKADVLKTLQAQKAEGVVFKRLDAPYTPGRPNSGGPQLKHKFYATLSAVVAKINAQRSVEIRLLGEDGWQVAGNVTIPANHRVPGIGEVVEIRYLYAFRQSGILFQPVYLGPRSDIDQEECLLAQLKFKPEDEEES